MTATLHVRGCDDELRLDPCRLFVAGFAARDEASARAHLDELAEIGVAVPDRVPTFYELDPAVLTTGRRVGVLSATTSGEAEAVLVRHGGNYYVGVGSDHTDRAVERTDIATAKAVCPKPISREVLRLSDCGTDELWNDVRLESWVDGQVYQRAPLGTLRAPHDLLIRLAEAVGEVEGDFALYMGTAPLLDGMFRYGERWAVRLHFPNGTELRHSYTVEREVR